LGHSYKVRAQLLADLEVLISWWPLDTDPNWDRNAWWGGPLHVRTLRPNLLDIIFNCERIMKIMRQISTRWSKTMPRYSATMLLCAWEIGKSLRSSGERHSCFGVLMKQQSILPSLALINLSIARKWGDPIAINQANKAIRDATHMSDWDSPECRCSMPF
jgi:hypothetical protein